MRFLQKIINIKWQSFTRKINEQTQTKILVSLNNNTTTAVYLTKTNNNSKFMAR